LRRSFPNIPSVVDEYQQLTHDDFYDDRLVG
jgi:hypothetical protein